MFSKFFYKLIRKVVLGKVGYELIFKGLLLKGFLRPDYILFISYHRRKTFWCFTAYNIFNNRILE